MRACAKSIAIALALAVGAGTPAMALPQQSAAKKAGSAAAEREFSANVADYLNQRKQNAGTLPKPTASASKLHESRAQIQQRLQAIRGNAKQGDIFKPEVAAYFRKQIAEAFRSPNGDRVLASLRRAEPVRVHVAVNQPYPDGIPLQSMPPSLLMKLPKLPKELEYRIVGNDLVLLDTAANLVIDILPNALPTA